MAQSTTLPLLAFFPSCILAYWRFPGDAHAPSHPYDVKEYGIRVIRPALSTTPGSSSDAHVPIVGTFSIRKQVPAYWKGVFWHLSISLVMWATAVHLWGQTTWSSLRCSLQHRWTFVACHSSPLFLFCLQGPMVIMSHFLGVFFF